MSEARRTATELSIGLIAAIAVGWLLNVAQGVLVPIVLGALIAILMGRINDWVDRQAPGYARLVPEGIRISITTAIVFFLMFVGFVFFARNLDAVVRALPQYVETFSDIVGSVGSRFDVEFDLTWASLEKFVIDRIELQYAIRLAVNSVSNSLGHLVLIYIYAILFLIERNTLRPKLVAMISDQTRRNKVWEAIDAITTQVGTYFSVKTLVNLVLGVICWAIYLAFGVEFAAFFAVLTAIFNYIPYVGSWIAVAFPLLFALGQFGPTWHVAFLLLSLTAVQFIVGYLWEPRLMGRTLNVSPVVVMISLAAWASLWGLVGAILSVILASGMITVLSLFPGTRPLAILLSEKGDVLDELDDGHAT